MPEMSKTKDLETAQWYQKLRSRCFRRGTGKQLIDIMRPCYGDAILDLGCGTGELCSYLAELVGQNGKVVAVDPDIARLKVARESHKEVQNLTIHEGNAAKFPGMSSETYDIVFSNFVLHWIQDKHEAFQNMFHSLKPKGKIVLSYYDRPTVFDHVYRELNPENFPRLRNAIHFESRATIEEMCRSIAGFDIIKSYEIKRNDLEFENTESMCSFFCAISHGVFDPQLVTKDRLASFCARYTSGEDSKPIKIFAEGDYYCVLIAAKPAIN